MRAAFIALTLAGLFWGLGFPLGKLALREVAPAHMVLLRFAVASIASLPFALGSAEARALFRSPAVVAAGVLYGLAFIVQFEGLAGVTVTLAALLVGAMPALVAVAAWAMGERVSRASWMGVAGATLGAALIAGKPGGAGTPIGIALSLASLVVFLGWLILAKRAPATRSPLAVPAVTLVVALLAILPVALVLHGPPSLAIGTVAWSGIIGQGLLSTFFATAAWQYGAARVDSASAGVFINIEPLFGALVGITLFGDPAGLALIAGGVLIVSGSIVVVLGERPAIDAPATPPHGLFVD
ncbi:DMT family transporter [Sphingomonas carotinifaciens]|uniref:EamA family transporter n=1 Tax=Sphingomonas carotinifaciens TaxID=1166323 RepID=A0A1G7QDU1_9SPHN|nr:DMT family transporter [Sphingomonas carotinifaciens]MBB4087733.1 drug/metabolite transporter (DMT)-like permease [Sphingomonas carotinifaciens]MWC44902.1 EamA family transporter [Sphingomonas carotinifaciens]SDF96625.1 Threonine/homoserine efflux transporter RhtA [Sphingomonas carotinifaciens]